MRNREEYGELPKYIGIKLYDKSGWSHQNNARRSVYLSISVFRDIPNHRA
jgi:hypothetical protein